MRLGRIRDVDADNWWVARFEGSGYVLLVNGEPRQMDFLTTRAAIGETEEEAVRTTIDGINRELQPARVEDALLVPTLRVPEIWRASAREARRVPKAGFTFILLED